MNNRPMILFVEDNPDDEELTLRALRQSHVSNDVIVVRDGEEALNYLFGLLEDANQETTPLPKLLLLDLKLPKVSGLEILKRVRSDPRTALLPVVILTSSSEDEDILSSYRFGANSYVRKPVEFQQFTEAVRMLGLYWLQINQPPQFL